MLSFPKLISSFPGANPYPFEHKIEVFVLFWGMEPPFSRFSSTKSGFLCAFGLRTPRFRAFRAQNRGFCAQEEGKVGSENVTAETLTTLPPHLRCRTSAPTPAHRHQRTSTSEPTPAHQHQRTDTSAPAQQRPPINGTRRRQVLSWHHVVLSWRRQVPSGAVKCCPGAF